jgi:hypothetical protein
MKSLNIVEIFLAMLFFLFFLLFVISGIFWDMLKYPFDKNKKNNRFHKFLTFIFIEYPAFFWKKPNIWKILAFPFLLIYKMFEK